MDVSGDVLKDALGRGRTWKVVGFCKGETLQDFRLILQLTTYLVESAPKEEVPS